ncbi:MAG: hypothetical protein ACP6IU_00170 [Candidatus Asgardarchaeia archaeon]
MFINRTYPFPECDSLAVLMFLSVFGPKTIDEIKKALDFDLQRTLECLTQLIDMKIIKQIDDKFLIDTEIESNRALKEGLYGLAKSFARHALKELEKPKRKLRKEDVMETIEILLRNFKPIFEEDMELDLWIKKLIKKKL